MSMFLHSGECSMNPAAISRMAAPPTEAEVTSSTTTINELPVDVLAEVLLCVPTPVDLIRAAAVSKQWRRVITSDAIATPNRTRSHGAITTPEPSSEPKSFLAVYRERKKSSIFLGLYIPRQISGPPGFHEADSIRPSAVDRGLKVAARKAWEYEHIERHQDHRLHDAVDNAFIRGPLGVHPDCRLLDCHNSLLLLTSGDEALEVRSPLPRESILVPFPPDADPESLEACLLQGHGRSAAAFRVVYLQHRREGRNRLARAAEYDSTRKSWQHHSWQTIKGRIEGSPQAVMHAGHRMFWRYSGRSQAALMLDTRKMEFSVLPLPTDSNFATGEIEDNVCCLVEAIDSNWFKVWRLEEEKLEWKLEKDISLDQVFAKHVRHRVGYHRPCAISNGMALMCSTTRSHHFVLDLNTCSLIDVFEFQGRSAYIMQMPWPPAFPHPTGDSDKHGEPASVDDSSTGAGELDEIEGLLGGIPALAEEPMHVDTCQAWPEPSPTPSLGCCFSTDPLALHPLEPLRVYLRTHALDQMVQAVGASAGLRVIKRVDQTLQELGVNLKPKVPTKAVCLEHIELQNELLTLLNLQKQLQTKEAEVSANWESSFTEAPSTPKVLSTGQVPLLNLQCPSLMETWLKLQRQLRGCIKIV